MKLLTGINLLLNLLQERPYLHFYRKWYAWCSYNRSQLTKTCEQSCVIPTAVRWMTPWDVTGHPMKPTNCSSGQCSATARTDRSVTCRIEKQGQERKLETWGRSLNQYLQSIISEVVYVFSSRINSMSFIQSIKVDNVSFIPSFQGQHMTFMMKRNLKNFFFFVFDGHFAARKHKEVRGEVELSSHFSK